MVLDPGGHIVRFNRACEQTTGYQFNEVKGQRIQNLFTPVDERERFGEAFTQVLAGKTPGEYTCHWTSRNGGQRLISWSTTTLTSDGGSIQYVIATGIDVTAQKRLEKEILEISGREQRRIGQDLHDGLGQHLTGIAFMSKVLEQRLTESDLPAASDAAKIVKHVNQAISTTRELARGLLPVLSSPGGFMSALELLSIETRNVFGIDCIWECAEPVLIRGDTVSTHLYHIAQEAVNNAIKHGRAKRIVIGLRAQDGEGRLTVEDDGHGIPDRENLTGMGLHIMLYRANMIGGSLRISKGSAAGTLVCCLFPVGKEAKHGDELVRQPSSIQEAGIHSR